MKMKRYFKRFIMIFLVIFSLIIIQNRYPINAVTVGNQIVEPEAGWKRYDDTNEKISFSEGFEVYNATGDYNGSHKAVGCWLDDVKYVKFNFYGSKIRLLGIMGNNKTKKSTITIDGNIKEVCSPYKENSKSTPSNTIFYEKIGLNKGNHSVVVTIPRDDGEENYWCLDSVDINSDGELKKYEEIKDNSIKVSNIELNTDKLNLKVGQTDNLVATITPNNASNKNVKWTSSNDTIAKVDENGEITALKVGSATITAKTGEDNLSVKCDVLVSEVPKIENEDREKLIITISNDTIKEYDVSEKELDEFLDWYNTKDKDLNYYVFENKPLGNESSYRSYVPYDKIEFFEIQQYKN